MPDSVFSLAAPIVGSRNPEAQGKRSRLVLIVDELLAGRGQKTIHSGFVNLGLFIIALALNGPEIAFHRLGNEVYARILASEVSLYGNSRQSQTCWNLPSYHGTVCRKACIRRSKRSPLSRSEKEMARYLARRSWKVMGALLRKNRAFKIIAERYKRESPRWRKCIFRIRQESALRDSDASQKLTDHVL